eukprot:Hpha_TRINITY_DN26582_c0_g1::TRINITY_DN26582_c0_g1_i1::g.112981::m.112981
MLRRALQLLSATSPKIEAIAKARALYEPGYAFPSWVRAGHPRVENADWAGAEVYYDDRASLEEVQRVVTEREPVNIGMSRLYDEVGLKHQFGWSHSRYATYWNEHKALAPNVAVYCHTPVSRRASNGMPGDGENDPAELSAHIINVIAPAFDDNRQPDTLFFLKPTLMAYAASDEMLVKVRAHYRGVFGCIFECARRQNLPRVALSLFGTGAFSGLFRGPLGEDIFHSAYIPALRESLQLHGERLGNVEEVSCFGTFHDMQKMERVKQFVQEAGKRSTIYGTFPSSAPIDDQTLLVNAWDPHSLCGNGNHADMSLDGFIGRHTAVSMLCWPTVNSLITYVPVNGL